MKRIHIIYYLLCIAVMIAIPNYIQLSHPDQTDTQLLIHFWPYWLICIAICVFAGNIERIFDFITYSINWLRFGGMQEWLFRHTGLLKGCYVCDDVFLLKEGHPYWDEIGMNPMCSSKCQKKYCREYL